MSFTTFEQTVDVAGYKATGLTALAIWYTRNDSGDTTSTSRVTLTALDASDVAIGSATASADIVGTQDTWRRSELTKVLPAGTVKVKYVVTITNGTALGNVDGLSLHIGQMSAELLLNGSFDSGDTDVWDAVAGTFSIDADGYATSAAATAGNKASGAASSEIKQDAAVPVGYEYGEAVLTFARARAFEVAPTITGTVTLEVLDSLSNVIATTTTGAEGLLTAGWHRRRLILALPDGAVTLRVRLITSAGGVEGQYFDDFSLRIHKDLDPAYERVLDFSEPHRAVMPRSFEEAYLAWWPVSIPAVWNGDDVLPSVRAGLRNIAATGAWSDASTPTPAKFVGHFTHDEDATSVDAYRFARALAASAVDIQIDGYGAFAKADTFSVAVCFRVTERAMALACGLVGNRDATDKGWGLTLDASGRVVAGVTGTTPRTATGTVDHRDGAAHWVLLTWNGTTLRVVDVLGTATNATDPGEFLVDEPMRIGRDGPNSATGGVDIARVLLWDGVAISQADFASVIDTIGDDPNGLVSWTSSQPVWIDGEADADGATLVRCAARHVPVAAGGLSIGPACTNLVLSTDYPSGSHCGPESFVTLTQGIIDPTGLARGVRVMDGFNYGYRLTDIPLGAGNATVIFYARTAEGGVHNFVVDLLDADENVEHSEPLVITALWQRFEIALTWTAPTPTGHLRFAITDDTTGFDFAHVVWVGQGAAATAYQDANTTVGDRHGAVTETMPLQLHREGEIEVDALVNWSTGTTRYIASVDNNTADQKNQRTLQIDGAAGPFVDRPFVLVYDNSGVASSIVYAVGADWSAERSLRARWNRLELPEALANKVAIAEDDIVEGQSAASFSVSTSVPSTRIRLGGGNPNGSTSPHALLRRVVVRAREEKLS